MSKQEPVKGRGFTDAIYQNFKLYIEGVQVPFQSISISSGVGGLPNANIVVPAQAGLMDIARFYSPKVHIFYTDRFEPQDKDDVVSIKKADKLLFSGLIVQVAYNKSKAFGGSLSISFSCVHRYSLIQEMLLDYSGWMNGDPLDLNVQEGLKLDTPNSQASIIEALAGITSVGSPSDIPENQEISEFNTKGKTSTLPADLGYLLPRIVGMPSLVYNFWNQMNRSAFNVVNREGDKYMSEAFVKIYNPLMENGLQFFKRIGGHYPVEAITDTRASRVEPCPTAPNCREKILIPPVNQMFLSSSVQADVTISNMSTYMQFSGEITSIYGIFTAFYSSIEYEIITLASPAEAPIHQPMVSPLENPDLISLIGTDDLANVSKDTEPIDTIIKPRLPFYFSPTCNVLFPGMYHTINVSYNEGSIPTRVNLKNLEGVGPGGWKTNFRGPHSIREAIATKVAGRNRDGMLPGKEYSLNSTTGPSFGAIGIYEQARGIKLDVVQLPRWLSFLSKSALGEKPPEKDAPVDAGSEALRKAALQQLSNGWERRHPGNQSKTLNPYNINDTDINSHHRLLFSTADYYYSEVFARSKNGRVECPFNPYLTPGYAMDIIEKNPLYPSFHAHCTSVTHSITAQGASTSVEFSAAMTYAELANYYVPFVNPMLQVTLGLAETPTLVGSDPKAKRVADEFYKYTLGVTAVAPDDLVNFSNMIINPFKWNDNESAWTHGSTQELRGENGGELNPMLSYEGNLSLTKRPIESRLKIEERFNIKFIDADYGNYSSNVMKFKPGNLNDANKFEIGQSQFLDYKTFFGDRLLPDPADPANIVHDPNIGNVQDLGLE